MSAKLHFVLDQGTEVAQSGSRGLQGLLQIEHKDQWLLASTCNEMLLVVSTSGKQPGF